MIDRHGISGAAEWKPRLAELIRDADTVVFVLSPSSVLSAVCAWEVEEADRFGKRIIPVLCNALNGAPPPVRLADLNYIYFYDEPRVPGSGFGSGLAKLISALNEDPVWLRENTRLLGLASHWLAAGRPANRLLSGNDIASAKAWLTAQQKTQPTALHVEFIRASQEEASARLSEERRQLEERERLVRDAGLAFTEKQAAQQREAEASRRVVRRTLAGMVGAIALATVAAGAWWWAFELKDEAAVAEVAKKLAIKAKEEAEEEAARVKKEAEEEAENAKREAEERTKQEAKRRAEERWKTARDGSIEWKFTNSTGEALNIRFYSLDRDGIWPGNGEWWIARSTGEARFGLGCKMGEKVCYGAIYQRDWKEKRGYWGVGTDINRACQSCCSTCDNGSHSSSLSE